MTIQTWFVCTILSAVAFIESPCLECHMIYTHTYHAINKYEILALNENNKQMYLNNINIQQNKLKYLDNALMSDIVFDADVFSPSIAFWNSVAVVVGRNQIHFTANLLSNSSQWQHITYNNISNFMTKPSQSFQRNELLYIPFQFGVINVNLQNINITYYTSCIFYCLYSLNTLIQSVYSISISHSNFNAGILCTYRYLTPTCFLIAKILMLIFYLSRLYKLFRGTSYEYNVCSLKILAAFITIGFSISGILFAVVAISGLSNAADELSTYTSFGDCLNAINQAPHRTILTTTAIAINLLVDLISSIIILRLYLRKLILFSLAYDSFSFKSKTQKHKNEKFMKLMLKTTNLVIISVATEYSLIFVNGARIGEYWLAFNHTMNVLCIYLSFGGFNDTLYDKLFFCIEKCCSRCCSRLCFCCCMPSKMDSSIMVAIQENSAYNSKEKDITKNNSSKLNINSVESSSPPKIPITPTTTATKTVVDSNGNDVNKNIEISSMFNKAIIDPVYE